MPNSPRRDSSFDNREDGRSRHRNLASRESGDQGRKRDRSDKEKDGDKKASSSSSSVSSSCREDQDERRSKSRRTDGKDSAVPHSPPKRVASLVGSLSDAEGSEAGEVSDSDESGDNRASTKSKRPDMQLLKEKLEQERKEQELRNKVKATLVKNKAPQKSLSSSSSTSPSLSMSSSTAKPPAPSPASLLQPSPSVSSVAVSPDSSVRYPSPSPTASEPPPPARGQEDASPLRYDNTPPSPKRQRQGTDAQEAEDTFMSSSSDDDDEGVEREAEIKQQEDEAAPNRKLMELHCPAFMGCRSVHSYKRTNTIDEGTFGVVHRAIDKRTGEVVALKKIKLDRRRYDSFPIINLREVNILMSLEHPNIVNMKEVVVDRTRPGDVGSIFMVMEYMDHDLKMLMKSMKTPFRQAEVKCLMLQLLEAVNCMHNQWLLHRDLKTSNLLMNNKGILKVCDFGLARKYGSPLGCYTQPVVTLWYRAPELLLGAQKYSWQIDMWSVGCIFAEFLTGEPLMAGKGELDQLDKIFKLLGTPNEDVWPGFSQLPQARSFKFQKYSSKLRKKFPKETYTGGIYLSECGFDLLSSMLCYDPTQRISAQQALNHPYFQERPQAQDPGLMPTFKSLNERENMGMRKQLKTTASDQKLNEVRSRLQEGPQPGGGGFHIG